MHSIKSLLFFLGLSLLNSNNISSQNVQPIVSDSTFVNLKEYSTAFIYDMKYATEDNFLKAKVYDCAECY